MKIENKKTTFILIVILLCISALFAIASVAFKVLDNPFIKKESIVNPNKEFFYKGSLYFYDQNKLLGTYKCDNDYCDYAYETIDDNKYNVVYHNDAAIDKITLVNNRYAFIVDTKNDIEDEYNYNSEIILYDVVKKTTISTYKAVKNYTLGIDGFKFIVQDSRGLWGVISLENDSLNVISPVEYNFISLSNRINKNRQIISDYFLAVKVDSWALYDGKTFEKVFSSVSNINGYNYKYIIVGDNNYNYYLYDYNNKILLDSKAFKHLSTLDKYIISIDLNNNLSIVDPESNLAVSDSYNVADKEYSIAIKEGNILIITIDGVDYQKKL